MVIAALLSFAALLVAWILAPGEARRAPDAAAASEPLAAAA